MTHDLAAISRQHHFAGQSVVSRERLDEFSPVDSASQCVMAERLGERLPECSMANHRAAAQNRTD